LRQALASLEKTRNIERLTVIEAIHSGSKREAMAKAFSNIRTKWVIWADGSTWFRRNDWLSRLCGEIASSQIVGLGGLGIKLCHKLKMGDSDPRNWFKSSNWYRGMNFRNEAGKESPSGNTIHYLNPGFFVLTKEAIESCKIPDGRLTDTGIEITIGEQLHQGGFKIKSFDHQQQYVKSNIRTNITYPWEITDL
jgi:hypothetical protein